jgi:outer membrane protein insertion porin family
MTTKMQKRNSRLVHYIAIIFSVFIVSCNFTKNIPKGDALYTGAVIKIEDSTRSKKEKEKVIAITKPLPRPKPNSSFLGIPIKLSLYNLGGDTSKKNFIRKFFRKLGEPPVLLSRVNLEYNNKVMSSYLENDGYFRAVTAGDTIVKNKKAHAVYTIEPGPQYTINEVNFVVDSSALGRSILATKPQSLLRVNDPFNFDVIKGERLRIDAILKEQGYYYFSPDHLIIDTDSTIGNNKVNMYLMVKQNTANEARKPYVIDDVFIYPTYRVNAANAADTSQARSNLYHGFYINDRRKRFKPKLFPRILRFDSGDVYNRKDHNLTLNRLINLDVFKFVKNRFELSPNSAGDTGRLNTYYYLTPFPRKSLRAELGGNTKSNNFTGSLITVTWRHRNLFKGAEHLDVHANVGSEVGYSNTQKGVNSFRFGAGLTFTTPKFVIPFFNFNTTSAYVPKSKIELDYEALNRQTLYTLNSFRAQLGYLWKPNLIKQHDLNLISINLVQAQNITDLYIDSIKKYPILRHAVDTQFIIGTNYSVTIDPLINNPKGTGWYFNGLADFSGNIYGLFTGANYKKGIQKRIIGVPFSQYIKAQADMRYYYALNQKTRLANRVILGLGLPYGNSKEMPFIKQYFIGGNNSVRAFRSRSIGPGTFRDTLADKTTTFFPDQSGDLKLELNTEYRYKINNIIETAFFIDAGNIWLVNKDSTRPGAEFTGKFLNQLAVGVGAGLRLDLTILLLRLDIATPIRKPWLAKPWVFNEFGKSTVFNLGIGYPF